MRLASIALIAACTHPPAEPPSGRSPQPAPVTAGPRVTFSGDFRLTGLPAVATDGSLVVIAHKESDGARGNPNLTLIARDRSDRVVDQLVVLTSDEAEHIKPETRVDMAQAWLDAKQRAMPLVPLADLGHTQGVTRETLGSIHWATSRITIAGAVDRPTPDTWLAKDHPLCDQCNGEICHNEAFLDQAFLDTARKVALVIVAYDGTDTCWEPAAQEHVVAW